MNTKKVIFAVFTCLTLMAASAAPYAVDDNESGKTSKVDKRKEPRPRKN